jgi:uncharacterized protein (TIGR02680 family)
MAIALQDDPHVVRDPLVPGRTPRWTLSRAGIINVYQYGDETLEFGGGRLLLRGVNGSGKSTAMNMLLPFLLDGDIRRIDAAGEQTGVLQSWMLSGRDESSPQPVGYLWLEVEKAGEYLSFGCGIRASRSTDTVSTWWFITSRRPGINLSLVEGRVPLSRDHLRAVLTPDPVYGQEERATYRSGLAQRLFGGADLEEHLHLLRTVRNPRIGDRIETELPQHLQNALPRLSEVALDDAAQPLEDLEEHRRIVTDMRRTAEALEGIEATFRAYARTELHRHADLTSRALEAHRASGRAEEKAAEEHTRAAASERNFRDRKGTLGAEIERLQSQIAALRDSDAYKSGTELNDLRILVKSLAGQVQDAATDLTRAQAAVQRAAGQLRGAHAETRTAHQDVGRTLATLALAAQHVRLDARPPGVPAFIAQPGSTPDLPLAPTAPLDTAAAERELAFLADAGCRRTDEVNSVEEAVRRIEPTAQALREAEGAQERARRGEQQAQGTVTAARLAFQQSVSSWQAAANVWIELLQQHHANQGLAQIARPGVIDRVIDELLLGQRITEPFEALVVPALEHHESRRADTQAALKRQNDVVTELAAKAEELAAKQLPDPPLLPWQRRPGPCLAELVDFVQTLAPAARAGLEAALESSGLLSAEIASDGSLRLASGQLVLIPDPGKVPSPLGALLRADVPGDAPAGLRGRVERILAGVSTDLTAGASTAVSVEGEFRVGSLRGRWSKPGAEHIGVTARRATLERQRAQAARALEEARAEQRRLAALLQDLQVALTEAQALRRQIPSGQELHTRLSRRDDAERALEQASEELETCQARREEAALRHAEAITRAQTTAARLQLPATLTELATVREELRQVQADVEGTRRELSILKRAVQRWQERGEEWHHARETEEDAQERLDATRLEHLNHQTRLNTLEARIGASYAQVVADLQRGDTALKHAKEGLRACDEALEEAVREVASRKEHHETAVRDREQAQGTALKSLAVLRQVLALPGLADAAVEPAANDTPPDTAPPAAVFPVVEDSVAGGRALVEAVRAQIARPQEPASAESVRGSIRARRDSIGAGWDAVDRQPDMSLPLIVGVINTSGHESPLPAAAQAVRANLTRLERLLSTEQQQALRNLLQGLVAREIAEKMHAAEQMIGRMNRRLAAITTSHGIGVRLQWKLRDDLDPNLAPMIGLLAKPPDLRTGEEDRRLIESLGTRISDARRELPGTPYRELIARVLDYRDWHVMKIYVHRPGRDPEVLSRRTQLSEGEKKMVTYLPMFAAVAASCDSLSVTAPEALRFLLLDDAFNKVSEDNHPKLFGLLVELDLDFIVTSERLWGNHPTVPELAITEVIRDAATQTIVLEHFRWQGGRLELRQ